MRHREGEPEASPFARFAFDTDGTPMRQHKLPRDCQSQSCATLRPRTSAVSAPEPVEHMRQVIRGNAGAGIDHADTDCISI